MIYNIILDENCLILIVCSFVSVQLGFYKIIFLMRRPIIALHFRWSVNCSCDSVRRTRWSVSVKLRSKPLFFINTCKRKRPKDVYRQCETTSNSSANMWPSVVISTCATPEFRSKYTIDSCISRRVDVGVETWGALVSSLPVSNTFRYKLLVLKEFGGVFVPLYQLWSCWTVGRLDCVRAHVSLLTFSLICVCSAGGRAPAATLIPRFIFSPNFGVKLKLEGQNTTMIATITVTVHVSPPWRQ